MNFRRKTITLWTERHIKFCLNNRVNQVAQYFWKFLEMQLNKYPNESGDICVGIDEFQDYVEKERGKAFTLFWVKKQIELLEELRVIKIIKVFGRGKSMGFKLQLKHIDVLFPPTKKTKKKSEELEVSLEKEASNDSSVSSVDNSSNNIRILTPEEKQVELERQHEILSTCASYQIYFDPTKPQTEALFYYDLEDLEKALEHFIKRGGHTTYFSGKPKIPNPQGFLLDCLKHRWWEDAQLDLGSFTQLLSNWFLENAEIPIY